MKQSKEDITRRKRKIGKAGAAMLKKFPFFDGYLKSLKFNLTDDVKITDKACVYSDTRQIYFNNDFVDSISHNNTTFVIAHEILHLALKHSKRFGFADVDMECANIAADLEINQLLDDAGLSIPDSAYMPDDFGVPRNKSAETYYDVLKMIKATVKQGFDRAVESCNNADENNAGQPGQHDFSKEKSNEQEYDQEQLRADVENYLKGKKSLSDYDDVKLDKNYDTRERQPDQTDGHKSEQESAKPDDWNEGEPEDGDNKDAPDSESSTDSESQAGQSGEVSDKQDGASGDSESESGDGDATDKDTSSSKKGNKDSSDGSDDESQTDDAESSLDKSDGDGSDGQGTENDSESGDDSGDSEFRTGSGSGLDEESEFSDDESDDESSDGKQGGKESSMGDSDDDDFQDDADKSGDTGGDTSDNEDEWDDESDGGDNDYDSFDDTDMDNDSDSEGEDEGLNGNAGDDDDSESDEETMGEVIDDSTSGVGDGSSSERYEGVRVANAIKHAIELEDDYKSINPHVEITNFLPYAGVNHGLADYSFMIPNSRMDGVSEDIIFPSMVGGSPHIACCIDVSISMSLYEIMICLSVVKKLTEEVSSIRLILCNQQPIHIGHVTQHDFDEIVARKLRVGGGTNMVNAMKFLQAEEKYDAIFILSDGETPYGSIEQYSDNICFYITKPEWKRPGYPIPPHVKWRKLWD